MYRVEVRPPSDAILAQAPDLRRRAEDVLIGILQTAEEIRVLQNGDFPLDSHLRLRIGDYYLSYTLDLDRRLATVVFVEHAAQKRDEPDDSSSAA
jgi:mRNA-degrading endonuclease RelE of RelBE toxin-antitoxin system